jgi:hypothetical protein
VSYSPFIFFSVLYIFSNRHEYILQWREGTILKFWFILFIPLGKTVSYRRKNEDFRIGQKWVQTWASL